MCPAFGFFLDATLKWEQQEQNLQILARFCDIGLPLFGLTVVGDFILLAIVLAVEIFRRAAAELSMLNRRFNSRTEKNDL